MDPTLKQILIAIQELKDVITEMNLYRFADQYISATDLALLLGVPRRTVMDWRREGVLPTATFGKKVFFRLKDVEQAFDRQFKRKVTVSAPKPAGRRPSPRRRHGNGWDLDVNGPYSESGQIK